MDVITKTEYYGLLSLKKHFINSSKTKINNELITKYSVIDLRKRIDLINTMYASILNKEYHSSEDLNNAKNILTHLLTSITEKDLEACLVVSEGDNDFDINSLTNDQNI